MSDDAWTLLAKALRSLTDEEQAVVLREVFGQEAGRLLSLEPAVIPAHSLPGLFPWAPGDEAQQPEPTVVGFLLRLPPAKHAALKTWCESHGYSMTVVVRGLIDRFLEERSGPPSRSAP
jgi:hypothetical protein